VDAKIALTDIRLASIKFINSNENSHVENSLVENRFVDNGFLSNASEKKRILFRTPPKTFGILNRKEKR
jgi:hypothetical protein